MLALGAQSLIDPKLLTEKEADWLDGYHNRVWERISPMLREHSLGRRWLRKVGRPPKLSKTSKTPRRTFWPACAAPLDAPPPMIQPVCSHQATLPFVRDNENVQRFGMLQNVDSWDPPDCDGAAIFNDGWDWHGSELLDQYVEAHADGLGDEEGTPKCDTGELYGTPETTETGETPEERRRLGDAVKASQEAAWRAEWRHRLECWWIGLPAPMQTELGTCLGAFGLHLASRLDASWRAAQSLIGRGPSAAATQHSDSAGGCDSLMDGAPELALPEFPQFGVDFEFRLPPIPELLPSWQRLQSLVPAREQLASAAGQQSAPRQAHWALPMLAGLGGGFVAFGAMLVAPRALVRLLRDSRLAAARMPTAELRAPESEAGRVKSASCVVAFSK